MLFETLKDRYLESRRLLNVATDKRNKDPVELHDMEDTECKQLKQEVEGDKDLVLGHPKSFRLVRCWVVDVHGQNDGIDLSMERIRNYMEQQHAALDQAGGLAVEVRKVMDRYNLTDSGFGCESWHLGCHCTQAEAQELCGELYDRFGKAIQAGQLEIDRHAWSLDFL